MNHWWTDEKILAAIIGGVSGLITTIAGALIALSNSHTIRSWMEQRGKSAENKFNLEFESQKILQNKFNERIAGLEEELRLQRIATEGAELSCTKKISVFDLEIKTLQHNIQQLLVRATAAEERVLALSEQQRQNMQRLTELENENKLLVAREQSLLAELNRRGGM